MELTVKLKERDDDEATLSGEVSVDGKRRHPGAQAPGGAGGVTPRGGASPASGSCTPLGVGTEETWAALLEGRSGIGPIEGFDASLAADPARRARSPSSAPRDFVAQPPLLRTMTRNDVLALAGADAGGRATRASSSTEDAEGRIGLFVGGNKEISDPDYFSEASLEARDEDGKVNMRRFGEQASAPCTRCSSSRASRAASLFYISQAYGLKGPNTYFAGTAEAGADADRARRTGPSAAARPTWRSPAASTTPLLVEHGQARRARRADRAQRLGAGACRPYDRDRDGTVLGEGAAFLVLEDAGGGAGAGARVYAEIAGFGAGTDTRPPDDARPRGTRAAPGDRRRPCATPRHAGGDVGYVAAHGERHAARATRARRAALRAALGDERHGREQRQGGHRPPRGAAPARSTRRWPRSPSRHGAVPPTLNLDNVDPDCAGLDWVPNEAREARGRAGARLARGFEGQNVALALRRVELKEELDVAASTDTHRVVVTGMGAITAQGSNARRLWEGVRGGRVAIRQVEHLPMEGYRTDIGGEVQDDMRAEHDYLNPDGFRDRAIDFALRPPRRRWSSCGVGVGPVPAERWGVVIGTCNAGLLAGEEWYRAAHGGRGRRSASCCCSCRRRRWPRRSAARSASRARCSRSTPPAPRARTRSATPPS